MIEPDYVKIPDEYFPEGVGPGNFCPPVLRAFAKAVNSGKYIHDMEMKSWVVLWLLDHVEWPSEPCPGYPDCTCSEFASADDPHGAFGAPGMMGG